MPHSAVCLTSSSCISWATWMFVTFYPRLGYVFLSPTPIHSSFCCQLDTTSCFRSARDSPALSHAGCGGKLQDFSIFPGKDCWEVGVSPAVTSTAFLLTASRCQTSHHLRQLSQAPILHIMRLRRTRATLPPLLISPPRPSLADLIARSIFLTHTTVVSRKLARSLVSIRLSRRLAVRPSLETLVERCVLPPECVPGPDGAGKLAPALVAKKRAVERERVKDGLRRWIGAVWRGEVRERSEGVRQWEERCGVGRVWRLRKFWERVGRGEVAGDLG